MIFNDSFASLEAVESSDFVKLLLFSTQNLWFYLLDDQDLSCLFLFRAIKKYYESLLMWTIDIVWWYQHITATIPTTCTGSFFYFRLPILVPSVRSLMQIPQYFDTNYRYWYQSPIFAWFCTHWNTNTWYFDTNYILATHYIFHSVQHWLECQK